MVLKPPPASSEAVHNVMVANRSTDTGPEMMVRRMLREAGCPGHRLPRQEGRDLRARVLLAQVPEVRSGAAQVERRVLVGQIRAQRRERSEEGCGAARYRMECAHLLGVRGTGRE